MATNKREQIIQAAYKVMSEKGYENASIKDIAHEAGITPGLVHYYFRNKEEVLMELLAAESNQYRTNMEQLQSKLPSMDLAQAAINEPKDRVERQPEWYRLRYELFALGLRNPAVSPGVNALLENANVGITAILNHISKASEEERTAVAAILLACFDGLALQKMLNPAFDLDRTYHVLGEMVKSHLDTPE